MIYGSERMKKKNYSVKCCGCGEEVAPFSTEKQALEHAHEHLAKCGIGLQKLAYITYTADFKDELKK